MDKTDIKLKNIYTVNSTYVVAENIEEAISIYKVHYSFLEETEVTYVKKENDLGCVLVL